MALDFNMTEQEILDHLEEICSTEDFKRSSRCSGFLRYVVGETLAGRTERIKAYAIAVSVLGRDANFDPQTDPVVRIEARSASASAGALLPDRRGRFQHPDRPSQRLLCTYFHSRHPAPSRGGQS